MRLYNNCCVIPNSKGNQGQCMNQHTKRHFGWTSFSEYSFTKYWLLLSFIVSVTKQVDHFSSTKTWWIQNHHHDHYVYSMYTISDVSISWEDVFFIYLPVLLLCLSCIHNLSMKPLKLLRHSLLGLRSRSRKCNCNRYTQDTQWSCSSSQDRHCEIHAKFLDSRMTTTTKRKP